MWFFVILLLILIVSIYWCLSLKYSYWNLRNVPNPTPSLLFGNVGASFSLSKSLGQIYCDIYKNYPNLRYVGFYKIRKPGVLLRDPDLIKDVLIKDFSSFHDNDIELDENLDPIGAKNPFLLKGRKWKIVRNQLTPAFTSKRLKAMYPLLEDTVHKLMNYLDKNHTALEATELCAKYTTEVVANCIFGLEAKSFNQEDPEFRKMGKKIFEPSFLNIIKMLLITLFPLLANTLKLRFFTLEVVEYFRNILLATMKYRKENNIIRSDFLDLMLELKNTSVEYHFTDDDVLAHCLGFLADGFETSASALSFTLYELAVNLESQEKLRNAIGSNKLTYDVVHTIPYLDAVLNESLRMHPPGMFTSRVCTKEYTFPAPTAIKKEQDIKIEVGTIVVIPIYALHYDKDYFYEPERFIPDRFMESAKTTTKCTFLSFGEGPRSCHGQRFAVNQLKVAIAYLVQNFDIRLSNKTKVPLQIDPAYLILHAKGGLWLKFRRRS